MMTKEGANTTRFGIVLQWVPSIAVCLFYIPNALDKLIHHDQTDKIIVSSVVMITAGIYILAAVALFLYHKTLLAGTALLSLYMSCIILIHLYKGKPHEVVVLILIATIFSAYIRKPNAFHSKPK